MKCQILNIKFLFLLLCGLNKLFGQDTLDYSDQHFKKPVVFIDSLKTKESLHENPITESRYTPVLFRYVKFSNVEFDSLAKFRKLSFEGKLDFSSAFFNSYCNFGRNIFKMPVDFSGAQFAETETANFGFCHFKSTSSFIGISCYNNIDFAFTHFDSIADFHFSRFFGSINFSKTHFSKQLNLSDVTIKNGATFTLATLPDTINFYNLKTEGEIDLSAASLDSNKKVCYINLARCDISTIRLNYTIFKLYFNKDENTNEITSVYQRLLKKFKDEGYEDNYQKLDIEFQKYKYNQSGQWFRSWIQEWWWNYGYNKEKVFRNTILLLVFFFFMNVLIGLKWGYNFLIKEVYEIENIETEVSRLEIKYDRSKIKLFIAWLPMIFIYTSMLFFILNLNVKFLRFKHKLALAYVLTVFIVGLACAAYIINFVLDK